MQPARFNTLTILQMAFNAKLRQIPPTEDAEQLNGIRNFTVILCVYVSGNMVVVLLENDLLFVVVALVVIVVIFFIPCYCHPYFD